jgi:hypothetical protein
MLVGAGVAAGGIALVVVRETAGLSNNFPKIAVKLFITLVLLSAMIVATRRARGRSDSAGSDKEARVLVRVAGLLALTNVAIALAWT